MAISASSIAGSSTLNELRTQFNNLVTDVTAIEGGSISYTTLNTTTTNATTLNVKEDGTIWTISQNINCVGVSNHNNSKQEQTKSWLIENSVNIIGWQDTGVAFHMLPKSKRLPERMKDPQWNKQRTSSYNNTHERFSRF